MSKKSSLDVEKANRQIVDWLKSYAENAKVNGFVVGISGGIDSAVTSTLCAQTGFKVLCVEMPIHQAANQVSRGREHIEQLKQRFSNVSNVETDLTSVFETFKKMVPSSVDEAKVNLSLANTRARLRMTSLYYLAGIHGLLVAGTGNKVEDFGIGFYTKYGDGGVDVSPIADLYKTEVYALARALDLPESIKNAIPTDGLWDVDRTDEQQIGATYPELEKIQKEWGTKTESDYSGRDLEVYQIFSKMHKAAQHKMNPIPVCDIPEEWRD